MIKKAIPPFLFFIILILTVYFKHSIFIMEKQILTLKALKEKKETERHELEVDLRIKIEEFFENN